MKKLQTQMQRHVEDAMKAKWEEKQAELNNLSQSFDKKYVKLKNEKKKVKRNNGKKHA